MHNEEKPDQPDHPWPLTDGKAGFGNLITPLINLITPDHQFSPPDPGAGNLPRILIQIQAGI